MRYYPPRFLFRRHEILRGVRPATCFLEIGCGRMLLTQDLLSRFQWGAVIDFNEKIVADYAKLPTPVQNRLRLTVGDFMEAEFDHPGYDCVLACEVIEHVVDDAVFVRKMASILNPGGQMVVSVPAKMRLWDRDDEIAGHIRRYEKWDIVSLIHNAGLNHIRLVSYGFPFTNLLRHLRIAVAYQQSAKKDGWSQERKSKESSKMIGTHPLTNLLGLVCNPVTTYPFSRLAACYNHRDLSDGYLVFAEKP